MIGPMSAATLAEVQKVLSRHEPPRSAFGWGETWQFDPLRTS